jgi:hypothetical protein
MAGSSGMVAFMDAAAITDTVVFTVAAPGSSAVQLLVR